MRYYEDVAGPELANEFYLEFKQFVQHAAKNPEFFRERVGGFRRANLKRFPYNFCSASAKITSEFW
jgi:hypothetical protein